MKAVYTRTRLGVWVRASSCTAEGLIRLQHQPKVKHQMGMTTIFGADSSVYEEAFDPNSASLKSSWSEGASMSLDAPPFTDLVRDLGAERSMDVVQGILNHSAGLFANGYGADESQVLSWFEDLESLRFIESSMGYRVLGPHSPTLFLEYGPVNLSVRDGAIDCAFRIGNESMSVEIKTTPYEWALVATVPTVDN